MRKKSRENSLTESESRYRGIHAEVILERVIEYHKFLSNFKRQSHRGTKARNKRGTIENEGRIKQHLILKQEYICDWIF